MALDTVLVAAMLPREMKFGNTEFEIKDENLKALTDLAKLVSPSH